MPKMLPAGRRYTYGDIRRFTCADVSSDIRRDGGSDRFVSKQAQVIKCQNLFIVFLCDLKDQKRTALPYKHHIAFIRNEIIIYVT